MHKSRIKQIMLTAVIVVKIREVKNEDTTLAYEI